MTKDSSLEALQKAMAAAEGRWVADEEKETGVPLTYEELTQLRKGVKVTVVKWYASLVDRDAQRYERRREVYRATLTRVRLHGWTDLKGFWSCRQYPTLRTYEDVQTLVGHEVGDMVPSYVICYKCTDGYSGRYELTSLHTTQVYRGWAVEP